MEDRDVAFLFQFSLDLKTSRSGDVLEVDAAEGSGDQIYCVDELIYILCFYAERECIDSAEGFEQDAFSFHNRHACFRTDVAESEDCGTVCDDSAEIVTSCELIALVDILLDLKARLRYAGRVGKRKIILVAYRNRRDNFNFALPLAMESEGFFHIIHSISSDQVSNGNL